jgi:hypothetical protein
MATTQTAPKAAAKRAPRVHKVAQGTVEGPKGKNLETPKEEHAVDEEQRKAERRQADHDRRQQFAPTTQTTPAVHKEPELTEEQKKELEFKKQVEQLAATLGINPSVVLGQPKQARAPKADKQQQNGITRPAPDSLCGQIWAIADKISHDQNGHPALISQVRAHPDLKDVNEHTIKTQFARWRSYNGIKGRSQLIPVASMPTQPAPAAQ